MIKKHVISASSNKGDVYRLSCQNEFILVPSFGSVFVYMMPALNLMLTILVHVTPELLHPGSCAGS